MLGEDGVNQAAVQRGRSRKRNRTGLRFGDRLHGVGKGVRAVSHGLLFQLMGVALLCGSALNSPGVLTTPEPDKSAGKKVRTDR